MQETAKERWDRNFRDLLQELRVAQAGVQILFAFLLTIPLSSGFPRATPFQRNVYMVALIATACAAAILISPVAFHRGLFRQGRKPELVRFAHKMASGGLGFMLISVVSAVLLITDFILSRIAAVVSTGLTGLLFVTFWGLMPLARREWGRPDDEVDRTSMGHERSSPPDGNAES